MVFASSPMQYPPTSSPRELPSPRKRRRISATESREPLKDIENNVLPAETPALVGGFVDEDDSEPESPLENLTQKIRDRDSNNNKLPSVGQVAPTAHAKDHRHDDRHDSACELLSSPPASQYSAQSTRAQAANAILHTARTTSGHAIPIRVRSKRKGVHYSELAAARSTITAERAQKAYYGIDIHALIDEGKAFIENRAQPKPVEEGVLTSVEPRQDNTSKASRLHLWTEKYRPRKFTDLIGDERTHRSVLRWLKAWDPVVFPSQAPPKPKSRPGFDKDGKEQPEKQHRKVLLLTGPPGLGKTTLAHVCAKQAGYETHEINASDERTKDVVKGRIRDMVGTENVKTVDSSSTGKKRSAKPVCVVVDEVDGVVSGSGDGGGGEGGFIKALLDLLATDQRNAYRRSDSVKGKRKGDQFRMLRPLILICNDVYHPSLRLLRHGPHAEVIHVRKPALQMVVPRLCSIFEREGVPADSDGVRTLCEAAWGVTSKRQGGKGSAGGGQGEGDIRGILVAGEWVAGKLRAAALAGLEGTARLTRRWIELNVVSEMAHGGGMAKSLGRGGARDVVERVFKHNAGFAATLSSAATKRKADENYANTSSMGASEAVKRGTMDKLREMVESSDEAEKILTDCFATYPTHTYQDTTTLSKPTLATEWLHFAGACSHRVHHQQEWDLAPYLSYPVLAFHHLFASGNANPPPPAHTDPSSSEDTPLHPLMTLRADAHAHESTKASTATLTHLQTQLSLPLQRSFRSQGALATELIPYTLRILNPAVKPVLVGGVSSVRRGEERERVDRSVSAMRATGVKFDKGRVDFTDPEAGEAVVAAPGIPGRDNGGWVYRMEPPLDELGSYGTMEGKAEGDAGKARYALRQVLANNYDVAVKSAEAESRLRRSGGVLLNTAGEEVEDATKSKELEEAKRKAKAATKRDFFGRPIVAVTASGDAVAADEGVGKGAKKGREDGKPRVWATYHEGFSNAVRKPITMKDLMEGL